MAEAETSSIKGLTRGKTILIGILSVVLVAVLYFQFGRGGEKPSGEPVGYRPPRPAIAVQPANATAMPVTLASAKTPSNAQQPGNDKSAATAPLIDQTRWKSPKVETIAAYDPFALPSTFPQPPKVAAGAKGNGAEGLLAAAEADREKKLADEVAKLHVQLEELKQQGVQVILRNGDKYVAVIGERVLHVGDKIDDFTVTAINPDDGVYIERKDSP